MKKIGKRIHIYYKHFGIFAKVNLTIICSMTLTMFLLVLLLIRFTINPSLEKDKLLNEEAAQNLYDVVQAKYNIIYNQSNLMLNVGHVGGILASTAIYPDQAYQNDNVSFINTYLQTLLYSDSDILDVVVLSSNTQAIYTRSSKTSRVLSIKHSDYSQLPEVLETLASERNIGILSSQAQSYAKGNDTPVITFSAKIFDPFLLPEKQVVGIILVNYPADVFSDAYQYLGALSDGQVYVLNEADNIVFSNDAQSIGTVFCANMTDHAELTSYPVGISGIRVLNIISDNSLNNAVLKMVKTMLKIIIPGMFVMVCLVLLLNHRYKKKMAYCVFSHLTV